MTSYGVVLRKLREIKKVPIKKAAKLIGRSAGWLSEIENGRGEARIGLEEFERIVAVYEGQAYREKFKIWVANAHKPIKPKKDIGFDGAILRYLREKANMTLEDAGVSTSLSRAYISKFENGRKPISPELRNRMLQAYGYSPSSFKNFTSDDKRAKNIPILYKLRILIGQLGDDVIEDVFAFALQNSSKNK